jgi:hypothetical protein
MSEKMETNLNSTEEKIINKLIKNKAFFLIFLGIIVRVLILLYYYYSHEVNPQKPWGDLDQNFNNPWGGYGVITLGLLAIFRSLSFGKIEIFAFWAFLWDLLVLFLFYFVLKSFKIENTKYRLSLLLINPFWYLTNSFSLINCGYHITDSFFFFFLFIALIFYHREEPYAKYLFYLFLGISICVKYYAAPALGLLFIKYLYEQDWKKMKTMLICTIPVLIIFLIIPFLYLDFYSRELIRWYEIGSRTPFYIRIIPIASLTIMFLIFRLKKSNDFEILFFSLIVMGSFMIFSFPYLRWFQSIIIYGILKQKRFFTINLNLVIVKREIVIDNHLLTFYLSIAAIPLAYLFTILF